MRAKIEGNLDAFTRPHVDVAPLSDAEMRARLTAMRSAGLLRPPALPEEFADEPTAVAVPRRSPIPREERERVAIEARTTQPTRTAATMHAAELADRCRTAASMLEAIAANVSQPNTARRQADAIVRTLVRALSEQVVIVVGEAAQ